MARPLVSQDAYRLAYRAQQASIRHAIIGAHRLIRSVLGRKVAPNQQAVRAVRRRYAALLKQDLKNVDEGAYSADQLLGLPFSEYARHVPDLAVEVRRAFRRAKRGQYRDLPPHLDLSEYPAYFRRNFHWQTDGYLSRRSADLYDVQVEFLFLGCAHVMRRQILPAMVRHARQTSERLRILDVGCGTGRTLRQVARALPGHKYYGVDLSPFYVEAARKNLETIRDVTLAAENAESLPFRDGYFDIVSSVYLFHELPRNTRRRVFAEMHRVLKPGGLIVVEDSAQLSDAADIAYWLENFSAEMHEPYYRDYLRDDLATLFESSGFRVNSTSPCWVAKVVTGHKAPQVERRAG